MAIIYKRQKRKSDTPQVNKRQTILSEAAIAIRKYGKFNAWEIADAIDLISGGKVKIPASLVDLVCRKYYDKRPGDAYFYPVR